MVLDGQLYVDRVLPFGLRSAPKIFSARADALEYIITEEVVFWLRHYLDDFVMMGPPDSEPGYPRGRRKPGVCVRS